MGEDSLLITYLILVIFYEKESGVSKLLIREDAELVLTILLLVLVTFILLG